MLELSMVTVEPARRNRGGLPDPGFPGWRRQNRRPTLRLTSIEGRCGGQAREPTAGHAWPPSAENPSQAIQLIPVDHVASRQQERNPQLRAETRSPKTPLSSGCYSSEVLAKGCSMDRAARSSSGTTV